MRISGSNKPSRQRREIGDDTKMGIVLLGVALMAFATYTLFLFAGFIADLIAR